MIRPVELIGRKRDGEELGDQELVDLVLGYTRGEIPDYQLAAFCMAVYFQGLSARETYALTDAMVQSGETIDLQAEIGRPVADKHSTGGVGDKASLVVGPLVAACGIPFGKMSGRGLGHTGGTLDKLESIPGFRIELSRDEFVRQVKEVGIAVIGQTAELVPADKQLYGLRDVTATVENVSLIAASIMSKKIAAGANAIVLDVKVGSGAFMKTIEDARALAEAMLELGRRADRSVVCELTDMDQPLGRAVGNAVEIREAARTLRGEGPADLTELSVESAAHLVTLCEGVNHADARSRVETVLSDGSAFESYERWVRAQGGDPDESALPMCARGPGGDSGDRRHRRPPRCARDRHGFRPPRGRARGQGCSHRPRRRHPLPGKAWRPRRRRRRPRGSARPGRDVRSCWGPGGRCSVRARGHASRRQGRHPRDAHLGRA